MHNILSLKSDGAKWAITPDGTKISMGPPTKAVAKKEPPPPEKKKSLFGGFGSDKDDKKKAGQSYTAFCESFSSDVSTLRDGCGRQRERKSKEEEEDRSKKAHVLAPEKLLLIELKALFAESYPPLTCKVRIYTTKRKQQENRFNFS